MRLLGIEVTNPPRSSATDRFTVRLDFDGVTVEDGRAIAALVGEMLDIPKLLEVERAARADHDACLGAHFDEELGETSLALRNALRAIAPVKEAEGVRPDPVPHPSHELVENADEDGDFVCVRCGLDRDDEAIGASCHPAPEREGR